MTNRHREFHSRIGEIRHHLAHAVMGLTALPAELTDAIPSAELRLAVRTVRQLCTVLDGWLARSPPV